MNNSNYDNSKPINQVVDNGESSTLNEKRRIALTAKLKGAKKPAERLLVFEKESLYVFTPDPEDVKPGGRFHPRKEKPKGRWIKGLFSGALGGLSDGLKDAAESLTANSNQVVHFANEKLTMLLEGNPQYEEILYSQLKGITCTEWSSWSGRKLSIILNDGTRWDYSIIYKELLPKPGPDSFEQLLGEMFGPRFEKVKS